MRVVIAPDKFKGSLDAVSVARAMAGGVRDVAPEAAIDLCPMSDGGEGFVETVVRSCSTGAARITRRVTGPLPERHVDATFVTIDAGQTAVIEMSSASGLSLLAADERNPLYTTSFGTGELIRFAAEMGCRRVLLGIGGSATCDAGIGCLQACGCHITMADHQYASDGEPLCGRDLDDVVRVKSHRGSPVDGVQITVVCDVTNPLYGPNGSAAVYGPQKGASPAEVCELDRMLASFAARQGWQAIADRPGAGAAGGIAFGLAAMFNAELRNGFGLVAETVGLADRIRQADLVLTGEGRLDEQTASGKVVAGVAALARTVERPCVAIVGSVASGCNPHAIGVTASASLVDAQTPLETAIREATLLVRQRTAGLVRAAISR